MNYQRHYDLLIDRARNRIIDGYSERHHVIPRCLGGNNKKENLVRLTPEEHYLAHQLLIKIYPQEKRLAWACAAMIPKTKYHQRNNKMFGWIRRKFAESVIGKKMSDETKEKISASRKGSKATEETKAALREGAKKRPPRKPTSQETKDKISAAKKGVKLPPRTAEHIAKIQMSRKNNICH